MRQFRVLTAILFAGLTLPAFSQAPAPAPAHDQTAAAPAKVTIYFYRIREAYGAALKPSVYCDGGELGRMRNGRFMSFQVAPGTHNITSTLPGSGASVDMKPGETYYIRVKIAAAGMFHGGRGQVTLVAPEQGKFESAQLKPAEPEDNHTDNKTPKGAEKD